MSFLFKSCDSLNLIQSTMNETFINFDRYRVANEIETLRKHEWRQRRRRSKSDANEEDQRFRIQVSSSILTKSRFYSNTSSHRLSWSIKSQFAILSSRENDINLNYLYSLSHSIINNSIIVAMKKSRCIRTIINYHL